MKIMVGYEHNNASEVSLKTAIEHARAFAAEVLLVTSMVSGDEPDIEAIAEAEKDLIKAKKYCEDAGVASETHLLIRGFEPGEDLVMFAQEQDVDEIIIGIKRRSKVGKFLFGSTAQVVILDAHCPVLAVK